MANGILARDILAGSATSFWVRAALSLAHVVKHEFGAHDMAEFDFRVVGDGRSALARYANNSNYRNDSLIRKESKSATAPRSSGRLAKRMWQ